MNTVETAMQDAFKAIGELTIEQENIECFWTDAQPLLEAHWREISAHADIPLKVDLRVYGELEALNQLCIIAARTSGRLVGYAVFFVSPHPHYKSSLQAQEDVIYMHPALRGMGHGRELLDATERILRRRGCQMVHHHVKLAHPELGDLLALNGYRAVETIFSKRLDRT